MKYWALWILICLTMFTVFQGAAISAFCFGMASALLVLKIYLPRAPQPKPLPRRPAPTEDELYDAAYPVITAQEALDRVPDNVVRDFLPVRMPCPGRPNGQHAWVISKDGPVVYPMQRRARFTCSACNVSTNLPDDVNHGWVVSAWLER